MNHPPSCEGGTTRDTIFLWCVLCVFFFCSFACKQMRSSDKWSLISRNPAHNEDVWFQSSKSTKIIRNNHRSRRTSSAAWPSNRYFDNYPHKGSIASKFVTVWWPTNNLLCTCLCSWLTQINYRICTFVLSEERTQLTIMFSLLTLGRRRNGTFSASTRRLRWTLREECELFTTSIIDYTVLVGQSPLRSHSIIYCNSVRVQWNGKSLLLFIIRMGWS